MNKHLKKRRRLKIARRRMRKATKRFNQLNERVQRRKANDTTWRQHTRALAASAQADAAWLSRVRE